MKSYQQSLIKCTWLNVSNIDYKYNVDMNKYFPEYIMENDKQIKIIIIGQSNKLIFQQNVQLLSKRDITDQLIKKMINDQLRFEEYTGRIISIDSEYTFGKSTTIKFKLQIALYKNEDYYSTFGFYETALDNLTKFGDINNEISQLALKLNVDISNIPIKTQIEKLKSRVSNLQWNEF